MASSNIIKEFLVSLGFAVDNSSLSKFTGGIATATKRAALLGATVKGLSAIVWASVKPAVPDFYI